MLSILWRNRECEVSEMAVKAQRSEEWARSVWRGTKSGTSNISLINPSKTDINNHIKREYFGSKRRSLFHSANRKEIPNRINHPPNMTTAVEAPIPPQVENVAPHAKPQELSFPLPKALHTTAHIHLTFLDTCTTVFLATSTPGDSAGSVKPMGSFVYAMPDVSAFFLLIINFLSDIYIVGLAA